MKVTGIQALKAAAGNRTASRVQTDLILAGYVNANGRPRKQHGGPLSHETRARVATAPSSKNQLMKEIYEG